MSWAASNRARSASSEVILPVCCFWETSLWVLHPFLGLLAQKWHCSVGVRPKPGLKDSQRAKASLLWRTAETAGVVQPGEGRAYWSLPVHKGAYKKDGEKLFKVSEVIGQGKAVLNWERVDLDQIYGRNSWLWWQRSCGSPIPGCIQHQAGWSYEQPGLVEGELVHGKSLD